MFHREQPVIPLGLVLCGLLQHSLLEVVAYRVKRVIRVIKEIRVIRVIREILEIQEAQEHMVQDMLRRIRKEVLLTHCHQPQQEVLFQVEY